MWLVLTCGKHIPGGLHEGGWDNLSWDVQVSSEVLDPLVSQEPIKVAPCVSDGHILLALEGLHGLDNIQVPD